jgi:hypothetical protein
VLRQRGIARPHAEFVQLRLIGGSVREGAAAPCQFIRGHGAASGSNGRLSVPDVLIPSRPGNRTTDI